MPRSRLIWFLAIAIAGLTADLVSKQYVFSWRGNPLPQNEWWIIEGFFGVETSLNNGALFGMGQGLQLLFAGVSLVAFVGIVYWLFVLGAANDRWLTVALAMISGGIFGNLYDRLGIGKLPGTPADYQNAVRDWILFRFGSYTWPNFNFADMLLVCGAAMLMWHALRQGQPAQPATD